MTASSRRGANAVEFALAMPFVLLILTGATDFALWSFTRQAVSRAVQDGAREASLMTLPVTATSGAPIELAAKTSVLESLKTWGLSIAGTSVDATWQADASSRMWLTVTATVPYVSLFGLGSPLPSDVRRTFVLYTQEQNPPMP